MAEQIRTFLIDGPAGRLECLLAEPDGPEPPLETALVCHPHPLYGGTMHNKVVHRLARALRRNGAAALRFNFRGVGRSGGVHAHGSGEIEDARAALEWLRNRYPGLPFTMAGFSFGAKVILGLGCQLDTAARLIAAGFPTRNVRVDLNQCTRPKIFIQSTGDEYGPRAELEAFVAGLPEPKRLLWVHARDHFFSGGLDLFEETVYGLGPAGRRRAGSG